MYKNKINKSDFCTQNCPKTLINVSQMSKSTSQSENQRKVTIHLAAEVPLQSFYLSLVLFNCFTVLLVIQSQLTCQVKTTCLNSQPHLDCLLKLQFG